MKRLRPISRSDTQQVFKYLLLLLFQFRLLLFLLLLLLLLLIIIRRYDSKRNDIYISRTDGKIATTAHVTTMTSHTTKAVSREGRRRGRSLERRSRGLKLPGRYGHAPPDPPPHSPGRGRTPSPQEKPPRPCAPQPHALPQPRPQGRLHPGDVLPSDQQGWLTDQLRGRKVWCAVADMLFCVFEAPDAKVLQTGRSSFFEASDCKVSKQVGHLLGVLEKSDSKGVVHFLGVFEAPDSKWVGPFFRCL